MKFEIQLTPEFLRGLKKLAKKHRSLKDDFKAFGESLESNPFQGVELAPGIRKIRMAISSKGRGKSGGARVITYTIIATEDNGKVFLLDIYDKADFSTVDVKIIQQQINSLNLG